MNLQRKIDLLEEKCDNYAAIIDPRRKREFLAKKRADYNDVTLQQKESTSKWNAISMRICQRARRGPYS